MITAVHDKDRNEKFQMWGLLGWTDGWKEGRTDERKGSSKGNTIGKEEVEEWTDRRREGKQ